MTIYRPHVPHIWKQKAWPQPGDLFYLGRKLLREPGYAALWRQTQDMSVLEKAGFINDGSLREEATSMDESFKQWTTALPQKTIEDEAVVLLSTGSFAPFHEGHLAMMVAAEEFAVSQGFQIAASYFSPSHDLYVSNKDQGKCSTYPASWRVDQIRDFLLEHPSSLGIERFVDPWESLIAPRALNFTTVVRHLQNYYQHNLGKKIKVLYVFGADNAAFAEAFESDDVYAASLCVGRPGSAPPSRGFFAPLEHHGSSTAIRRKEDQTLACLAPEGCYFLRDEGSWALKHWEQWVEPELLKQAWSTFGQKIRHVLEQSFTNYPHDQGPSAWQVLSLSDQRNWAKNQAKIRTLISLDPCLDEIDQITMWPYSRYFSVCNDQAKPLKRGLRPGKYLPENFPQEADLIDDDAVSGQSLMTAQVELQKRGVKIHQHHLLLEQYAQEQMFDVVDLRDFLLGSREGGLVIQKQGLVTRVPYVFPYVDLHRRARLPRGAFLQSSLEIWQAAEKFFKDLPFELKVKHMHASNQDAMLRQWSSDTLLQSICVHWQHVLTPRIQP